jgi:hypothetical protein
MSAQPAINQTRMKISRPRAHRRDRLLAWLWLLTLTAVLCAFFPFIHLRPSVPALDRLLGMELQNGRLAAQTADEKSQSINVLAAEAFLNLKDSLITLCH